MNTEIITYTKFNLSKYLEILDDSLELILCGISSSKYDKMIVGIVPNLVEVREEKVLKRCLEVKIGQVDVNFFDVNWRS
jgi:hypothetical protein